MGGLVNQKVDHSTQDLASCLLKLRDDLVFVPQVHGKKTFYHVEIVSLARFYRIGYSEYVFISMLDGKTSFAEALTVSAQTLGRQSLSKPQAIEVLTWLLDNQLAKIVSGSNAAVGTNSKESGGRFKNLNPFWMKIPLCQPNRLFDLMAPYTKWIFSPLTTVCCLFIIFWAAITASTNWERFANASDIVFSPSNWIWMFVAWVFLKVVHEFAHGIACKRYGGDVREMGITLILFAPLAYIDVTSSWRFPTKWQRIFVAGAGMYIEIFVAAVALLIWSQSESQLAGHLLYNVILMASISTLLFNANPLMRFDGYYILSDLIEIPNLYTQSSSYVQRLIYCFLFGKGFKLTDTRGVRAVFVRVYGLAAAAWRMLVCASLMIAAACLFKGAGLILAVFGLASWFMGSVKQLLSEIARRRYEHTRSLVRAAIVFSLTAIILSGVFVALPSPSMVSVPGIIDFEDMAVVRARASGFVDKIHIRNGQTVKVGDPLFDIRNDELENELHDLELQIEQSRIKYRIAVDSQDAADLQMELRDLEALEKQAAEKKRQLDGLTVLATKAGRILVRSLDNFVNTYVDEGEELAVIGFDEKKELVLSVQHRDIDEVLAKVGSDVRIRVGSRRTLRGTLTSVDPRATTSLTHDAMAATYGGPLAVRKVEGKEEKDVELEEPRFKAIVAIDAEQARTCYCGEQGYAVVGLHNGSFGTQISRGLSSWVRTKVKEAKARI